MPRADVPIGRCKAVLHERRLAKRGSREPNNQKADGTNKPCAFYSGFCGEKNPIYGRKKGAKDKQPRRPPRPVGGMILPSGREVGDLSPAFPREVPSVNRNLVAPAPSMFSVGTQQAWNYPFALSRPFGLGYFAM